MKICIPSKDRAETMTTHLFFNPKDVLIFVEPQEIKKYKIFHPEYEFINIEQNNKGVSYARNYILNYVGNENIIMADDDYEYFGKRNKIGRYNILQNCQEIIECINTNLKKYQICGIADDMFSYFSNKGSDNKRIYKDNQIVRDFYGIDMKWLTRNNIRYDENLKSGEDVDFNILVLLNNGHVCNDYLYSRKKIYGNTGGLAKNRGCVLDKDTGHREHFNWLVDKYGGEFFSTSHDQYGNFKSKTLKFKLLLQRLDVVKNNIKKFENEQRIQSKNT